MKWNSFISIITIVFFSFICIQAINDDGSRAYKPTPLHLKFPKSWPQPQGIYATNPLTSEGFELGKKLFYDPLLSKDSSISCASCHQQFASFSTFDHDLSHGVTNTFTSRNAPALINLAWMKGMHWDGGINHIEVQPLSPLTNPNEMGSEINNIISYLNNNAAYKKMFKAAFGDATINSQRTLKALAQFTGSMISCNSKYDRVKRGVDTFTIIEKRGYEIYKMNCSGCHKEPLFTDNTFRNNGLPLNRFNDIGRQKITGNKNDSLKFKVPTLRNVQVTFPYMHDGSMNSIPKVIDHYRNEIADQPTLDPLLKKKIEINDKQLYELMYFLFALTDSSYLKDKRFSGNAPNLHDKHK